MPIGTRRLSRVEIKARRGRAVSYSTPDKAVARKKEKINYLVMQATRISRLLKFSIEELMSARSLSIVFVLLSP